VVSTVPSAFRRAIKLCEVEEEPELGVKAENAPPTRILPSPWTTIAETVELGPGSKVSTVPSAFRRAR
jgi:hypothetical protein